MKVIVPKLRAAPIGVAGSLLALFSVLALKLLYGLPAGNGRPVVPAVILGTTLLLTDVATIILSIFSLTLESNKIPGILAVTILVFGQGYQLPLFLAVASTLVADWVVLAGVGLLIVVAIIGVSRWRRSSEHSTQK